MLVTLAAVTTAFALSQKPKTAPNSLHAAITPVTATPAATPVARQAKGAGDDEAKDDHDGKDGEEKDGKEKDDAPLTAKITSEAAKAAALTVQPGAAGKTELEDENGTTVYGIAITAADGKKYDVKVDANTGKVLKSEADDENEGKDGEDDGEKEDDAK